VEAKDYNGANEITNMYPESKACVVVSLCAMVLCSLFRGFELLTLGISIMRLGLGGILGGIVLPSWLL